LTWFPGEGTSSSPIGGEQKGLKENTVMNDARNQAAQLRALAGLLDRGADAEDILRTVAEAHQNLLAALITFFYLNLSNLSLY
jgi:hypothetical protein